MQYHLSHCHCSLQVAQLWLHLCGDFFREKQPERAEMFSVENSKWWGAWHTRLSTCEHYQNSSILRSRNVQLRKITDKVNEFALTQEKLSCSWTWTLTLHHYTTLRLAVAQAYTMHTWNEIRRVQSFRTITSSAIFRLLYEKITRSHNLSKTLVTLKLIVCKRFWSQFASTVQIARPVHSEIFINRSKTKSRFACFKNSVTSRYRHRWSTWQMLMPCASYQTNQSETN